jgi:hypothetical protein
MLGRYHPSSAVESIQKTPSSNRVKSGLDHGRAWRQVASPKLDHAALHLGHSSAGQVDRRAGRSCKPRLPGDANVKAEQATLIRRLGSSINPLIVHPWSSDGISGDQLEKSRCTRRNLAPVISSAISGNKRVSNILKMAAAIAGRQQAPAVAATSVASKAHPQQTAERSTAASRSLVGLHHPVLGGSRVGPAAALVAG